MSIVQDSLVVLITATGDLPPQYNLITLVTGTYHPPIPTPITYITYNFDTPQAPFMRIQASASIDEATKKTLQDEYNRLNPAQLKREIVNHVFFYLNYSYNTIFENYTQFVTRGEKMQKRAFVSFSGGKDSHLSLLKAREAGFTVCTLLSMVRADGRYSASHHLPVSVLQRQGESLGIPLLVRSTSWEEYERNFLECLSLLKEQSIEYGIFGDIDVIEHRQWVERVCGIGEMEPFLPLWGYDHLEIAREFVRRSFEAFVIVVKDQLLPLPFVGRKYDEALINELLTLGVDPCGENGEFHTLVVNGPLYQRPLSCRFGEVFSDQGYHFVRIE